MKYGLGSLAIQFGPGLLIFGGIMLGIPWLSWIGVGYYVAVPVVALGLVLLRKVGVI